MMSTRISFSFFISMLLVVSSCSSQDNSTEQAETNKSEPHRYGGWYCPDNFGFVPVDIKELSEVPAISDRLPTQEELNNKMSLINVDTEKYPDARALEMDLPRLGRINSPYKGIRELVIVIQAIVVSGDTVVGYRFPNGGNGSAWLSDVSFLSESEVAEYGSQPFYYSTEVVNASKEEIWEAARNTDYFKQLGEKFDKKDFFNSDWTSESKAHLEIVDEGERATGFVGTHFGNVYLHIDYVIDGFHYSEKMLMIEDHEANTTKLFFACGPFPDDFEKQNIHWSNWFESVKNASESD